MRDTPVWRAIKLSEPKRCTCGFDLEWVGIQEYQTQPEQGDLTVCPACLTIYKYDRERGTVHYVPESQIPATYLRLRDVIANSTGLEARHDKHGPN